MRRDYNGEPSSQLASSAFSSSDKHLEEHTEDFSSSDPSDCSDDASSSELTVPGKFSMVDRVVNLLPESIARKLDKYSNNSYQLVSLSIVL